jgi:hypothetical protein
MPMAYSYGIETSSPARSPARVRPYTSPSSWTGREEHEPSSLAGTGYWGLSSKGGLLSPRRRYESDVEATRRRGR